MIWSKSNVSGNDCQHQRNVKIFKCQANQTTHPSTPCRVKKNGFHHDMVKIKCFRQQLPTPMERENFKC